jgi:hypothetical protein
MKPAVDQRKRWYGRNGMLREFLEKALAMGCNSIEIEYKDRKEWITAFRDCVGCGIGCLDPDEAKPIFKDMDALKRRKEVTIGGARYRLVFSQHESFGEWIYRIQMREMDRTTASSQRRYPRAPDADH